jgi:hypothetical protein
MPAMRDWTGVVSGDYRIESRTPQRTPCGHAKWMSRCVRCGAISIASPLEMGRSVKKRTCACKCTKESRNG